MSFFAQWSDLYHLPGFHEPFSAISHLFGAVLFLFLGALLLRKGSGDPQRLLFLGVYAFTCVFLFAMSGVYHQMVRGGTAHRVLERLDHGAIFALIAGSFTPAHGLLFRGPMRWGPLLLVWTAAVAGIALKTVFFDGLQPLLGLVFYLALGWVGAFSAVVLALRFGLRFIRPLVLGGVLYSLGGILDYTGWGILVPGVVHSHEVAHILVLLGALCHWWFVWGFADGRVPNSGRRVASLSRFPALPEVSELESASADIGGLAPEGTRR